MCGSTNFACLNLFFNTTIATLHTPSLWLLTLVGLLDTIISKSNSKGYNYIDIALFFMNNIIKERYFELLYYFNFIFQFEDGIKFKDSLKY